MLVRKGYFISHCYSTKTTVNTVTSKNGYDNSDITFLNTIDYTGDSTCSKTMFVDGKQVCFNLDTGAEATVVSEEVMKHLGLK